MAQEDKHRLAEWLLIVRDSIPMARERLGIWFGAVREEPSLFWQTVSIRYATYALGLLALLWGVGALAGMLAPALPANAKPAAVSADFHVICAESACGHHFMIHREFGFGKFPVACPKCEKKTGRHALRCFANHCQGAWVAPVEKEGRLHCPDCDRMFEK